MQRAGDVAGAAVLPSARCCNLAPVRRGAIVRIALIGVFIAIICTLVAVLIPWLPDSASKQMDRIEFIYWFATVISIAIFALVMAVLLYSVIAFRSPPEDESDGPSIHGHTGLEIAWTVVPADPRHRDRRDQRRRPLPERKRGHESDDDQGVRPAVRLAFPVPGREEPQVGRARDAARPQHHVRASSRPT